MIAVAPLYTRTPTETNSRRRVYFRFLAFCRVDFAPRLDAAFFFTGTRFRVVVFRVSRFFAVAFFFVAFFPEARFVA